VSVYIQKPMCGQIYSTLCSMHIVKKKINFFKFFFVLEITLETFARAACTSQLVFTVLYLRHFSGAHSSMGGDIVC